METKYSREYVQQEASSKTRKDKVLLKDKLELVKIKLPEGKTRYTIKPLEFELSFDKGFYVFIRAIQLLTQHNKDVILVGLAGPSGSGKTAFSEKIQNFIPGCAILSMDNYNDGSKVIDGNFDDPRITDYDTLLRNIHDLKEGRPTEVPIYDFKESRRMGTRKVDVPESRVVILEGIYALSQRIRPLIDLRVSITGGVHFDLVKRVLRDIDRSGQAPEEIIQQISDTVYPMYKAFIEPDLKAAHLRIYNRFNPFSGFMSPTYILKSAREVPKQAVRDVLQADHVNRQESETYDIYLLPPNEDPETCQSWLRMRYRDGRYNLMFEEWVVDGVFIISPRVTFEVPVRILGGLMALGYEIGTIMRRRSDVFSDEQLTIKYDYIEGMDHVYIQLQGKDRDLVAEAGRRLGLEGSYIAHSYIELVQLENLTSSFQSVTEDLKKRFAVNGEPLIDESVVGSFQSRGSSPASGLTPRGGSSSILASLTTNRTMGFLLPSKSGISMSTSAPVASAPIAVARPPSASGARNGLLSQHLGSSDPRQQQNGIPAPGAAAGGGAGPYGGGGSGSGSGGGTPSAAVPIPMPPGATGSLIGTYDPAEHQGSGSGNAGGNSPEELRAAAAAAAAGLPPVAAGGAHRGGGSRPGSRPSTPTTSLETQVCRLVQSQQQLSNQLEELSLQIGQAEHGRRLQGTAAAAAELRAWERAAWALGGVALGACASMVLLRAGRS